MTLEPLHHPWANAKGGTRVFVKNRVETVRFFYSINPMFLIGKRLSC